MEAVRLPSPRRALLIVNRKSSRAADAHLEAGLHLLAEHGLAVRQEVTERPDEIESMLRRHARETDLVILGGGDGTISRALPVLLETSRPLGILPLGTANDFAHTLGIPDDVEAACAVIAAGRLRHVDVGVVNGIPFVNAASLGLSVTVARELTVETKRRLGVLSYPLRLVRAWRRRRPFRADVECDGRRVRLWSLQVHVGNTGHYGGGMVVSQDAKPDDGRLVLASVPPRGVLRLLLWLPALRRGRHAGTEVAVLRGTAIELRTRPPRLVATDGEVTGRTPASFRVLPRALAAYAPEAAP